jgi:hypothetical protein
MSSSNDLIVTSIFLIAYTLISGFFISEPVNGVFISLMEKSNDVNGLMWYMDTSSMGLYPQKESYDALIRMGQREKVSEYFSSNLNNTNKDKRLHAAYVLNFILDKKMSEEFILPLISVAVNDNSGDAAEAVGKIGKPAEEPVFNYVENVLKYNNTYQASVIIADIGDEAVIDKLSEMLKGDDESKYDFAAYTLLKLLGEERAKHFISNTISSKGKAEKFLNWHQIDNSTYSSDILDASADKWADDNGYEVKSKIIT